MSQVASLHLVPEDAIAAILEAAAPKKAGWFKKPKDTFWETLAQAAPDVLRETDWDGYVYLTLLEFVRDSELFDFSLVEQHPLAQRLSEARESFFAAFDASNAAEFINVLSREALTEPALTEFAMEFSGVDAPDAGEALIAAAACLQRALKQVKPGTIGLLHIG